MIYPMHDPLIQIGLIAFFSITSQWLGWRIRIPAIVFLLLSGFLAGPILGWIDPQYLLGDFLQPAISVAVGIILFEGSLTLNFKEVKKARFAIRHIVIIGAPVGWILMSLGGHYLGGLSWPVAITFGALLIVTGPTVIMPILRQARMNDRAGSVLKWEGIVNDPIGAVLAVLAYEYFHLTHAGNVSNSEFFTHTIGMLIVVVILSIVSGILLARILNRGLVPEYMKSAFLTSMVVILFIACNNLLHESGLIGVTILGITLANLNVTSIDELKRFKETITIMLVSGIFILLTAQIDPNILFNIDWRGYSFIAAILFVIRPLTVIISSIGTTLTRNEIILASWIAPRGIVCAAVAGLMGPLLVQAGYPDGAQLLPLAFAIVILTVVLHGLTAKPLAKKLGLAHQDVDGLMIVGASEWTLQLAETLKKENIAVMIAGNTWHALKPARMADIPTYYGEVLSEETEYNLEMAQYNKLLAATGNPSYNTLACSHFAHEFGRESVFQVSTQDEEEHERKQITETMRGRTFVDNSFDFWTFTRLYRQGWRFKATKVNKDFNLEDILKRQEENDIQIIGVIKSGKRLRFKEHEINALAKDEDVIIVFEKEG